MFQDYMEGREYLDVSRYQAAAQGESSRQGPKTLDRVTGGRWNRPGRVSEFDSQTSC